MAERKQKIKCELYNDSMQNWKSKPIQKAQLIIADIPYNIGTNFYGFEINKDFYKRAKEEMLCYSHELGAVKDKRQVSIFDILREGESE